MILSKKFKGQIFELGMGTSVIFSVRVRFGLISSVLVLF